MNTIIPLLIILFSAVFLGLVFILVRIAMKRENKVYEQGIEVDSVVSRIKPHLSDGKRRYSCYVRFFDENGMECEALLNVRSNLPIGRSVRIRYLPENPKEAVFISQEL